MSLNPETMEKLVCAGLTVIHPDPAANPSYRLVFISKIAAGFPSPADDYVERRLDLKLISWNQSMKIGTLRSIHISGGSLNSVVGCTFHRHWDCGCWWCHTWPLLVAGSWASGSMRSMISTSGFTMIKQSIAGLAQTGERRFYTPNVAGSIPATCTNTTHS